MTKSMPASSPGPIIALGLAASIVAVLVASGLGSWPEGARFALMVGLASVWLRRRVGQGSWGMILVCSAVAFHARSLFPHLWVPHPEGLAPLWLVLAEAALALLVASATLPSGREIRALLAVLVSGVPVHPAGDAWASIPFFWLLACSSAKAGSWWWIGAAWAVGEWVRAPCRYDAAVTLAVVAILIVAIQYGRNLSRDRGWMPAYAMTLALPLTIGAAWSLLGGFSPTPTFAWGANANPLVAQATLGLLLMFVGLRPRHPRAAWLLLAPMGGLLILRSIGAVVCAVPVALLACLKRGKTKSFGLFGLGLLPLLTPCAAFLAPRSLPPTLSVSLAARRYHWEASLRFVASHPFGAGLGLVHPRALGMVAPPTALAVVPGDQMQHAHHALLHIAEQGGIPLALAVVVAFALWLRSQVRAQEESPWAYGVLYLWLNNGVDLTLSYEALVVATGLLIGLSSRTPARGSRAWVTLLLPATMVWLTAALSVGHADLQRRGGGEDRVWTLRVRGVLARLWGSQEASPPGSFGPFHGRCPFLASALVEQAERFIASWHPALADSLLLEAVRLDPAGVIPHGGGRAQVMRALLRRDTGGGTTVLPCPPWADGEATKALAAIDYFWLRNQPSRAESVVKHTARRSPDGSLIKRLEEAHGRRSERAQTPNPADALKENVERLIARGFTRDARLLLASPPAGSPPWLITLLRGKVALAEGDMDRAATLSAQAVAESGGADAARWELVGVLIASSRAQEALAEVDLLVRRRPRDPGIWLLRAQAFLALGRAREALADIERARSLGGEPVALGIAQSQALRLLGHPAQARRVLVGLLRDHPTVSWPAWELASWAESEGRLEDALRWASMAVARDPENPGARLVLGRVLAALGRRGEARRHFCLVLSDPRAGPGWHADAREALERLDHPPAP